MILTVVEAVFHAETIVYYVYNSEATQSALGWQMGWRWQMETVSNRDFDRGSPATRTRGSITFNF